MNLLDVFMEASYNNNSKGEVDAQNQLYVS